MTVTWNSADKSSNISLSNGDLTITNIAATTWAAVRANVSKSSGKWYFEFKIDAHYLYGLSFGWAVAAHALNLVIGQDTDDDGYGYYMSASNPREYYLNSYTDLTGGATATDDIGMVALDLDNGEIWYGLNGTWLESGNPATRANPQRTGISGTFYPAAAIYDNHQQATVNFGATAFAYTPPSGFSGLELIGISEEGVDLSDTPAANVVYQVEIIDGINLGDTPEAAGGSSIHETADDIGLDDSIDVNIISSSEMSDNFAIGDLIDASIFPGKISDEIGMSDLILGGFEFSVETPETIGIDDEIDGLNWTQWLRQNGEVAIRRYFLTLTGEADGKSDVEIPINAFQARKRSGYSTYLSVNIPGFSSATYITNRINGEMVIEIGYEIDGSIELREEILRADLSKINDYEGGRRRAYQLIGYKTETYQNQIAILENPSYKATDDGRILYRFPFVDPFVNPGDTCKVGNDQFTIDYITYTVSERSSTMEIREIG